MDVGANLEQDKVVVGGEEVKIGVLELIFPELGGGRRGVDEAWGDVHCENELLASFSVF